MKNCSNSYNTVLFHPYSSHPLPASNLQPSGKKNLSCMNIVPFSFLLSATRLSPISEMVLILCRNLHIFRAFIKAYICCRIILSTCEPGMTPDSPVSKENHEGLHTSRPGRIMIDRNQNNILITTGAGIPGRST
jgi:hypothetical protein